MNEERVVPDFRVSKKDNVFHHNPRVIEPTVPDEVEVLEENKDCLIVFKPAPMPMHPGGRYNKNTLTNILEEKGYSSLKIIHRLDAVTSGVVLFARNKKFAKKAMHCFTNGEVRKTYFALVAGAPQEHRKTITAPIKRKNGFIFECGENLKDGKEAETRFEIAEKGKDSSLIKCTPVTGRTHQIRLHLAKWGFPIVDDPIYGKQGDSSGKTIQNRAISLLSAGLEIHELGVKLDLLTSNE